MNEYQVKAIKHFYKNGQWHRKNIRKTISAKNAAGVYEALENEETESMHYSNISVVKVK